MRLGGDSRRNLGIYGLAACGFSFSAERHTVRNLRTFLAGGHNDDNDYDDADGDSINIYRDGFN